MTNAVRSEVVFKAGGRNFTVRPSYDLIAKIEDALDAGIGTLLFQARHGALRAADIVRTVRLCLQSADPKLTDEQADDLILSTGPARFVFAAEGSEEIGPLLRLCALSLYGPPELQPAEDDVPDDTPGN